MSSRWHDTALPRGDEYDERWRRLADAGQSIHGEADLIESLLRETGGGRVLDAGCGTGRVAIELAARGFSVVGMDLDANMLETARVKASELRWIHADLAAATEHLTGAFDVVALAGNVMIFVAEGTEGRVLEQMGAFLGPDSLLVAGFALRPGGLTLAEYDRLAEAAGLQLVHRWATWDRQPFAGGDYAVSVHRLT
ncbi:SAM-dependent methyltransferase [Mycolicibacterium moriokaense]|uniref:SAM-dependent methyltransferase n=1 Tax=Mycolicibacterium moriokaense TaxID=39691 RepID=A0AAD1HE39_9MYCO|nr:class I SAM-dependent methyltransferase [Mycolicibacterium moriokaense]MCV7038237.1 methyltransferase domain-containing protein [Mycolicibacterium moriokaense]ORB24226.1 SAM-dependent methyltransferase [Mycolicibacterium moriokaense]BBX02646.1 SAM-dependent methyltransferase [Mycolicibacterium moriokaense]